MVALHQAKHKSPYPSSFDILPTSGENPDKILHTDIVSGILSFTRLATLSILMIQPPWHMRFGGERALYFLLIRGSFLASTLGFGSHFLAQVLTCLSNYLYWLNPVWLGRSGPGLPEKFPQKQSVSHFKMEKEQKLGVDDALEGHLTDVTWALLSTSRCHRNPLHNRKVTSIVF